MDKGQKEEDGEHPDDGGDCKEDIEGREGSAQDKRDGQMVEIRPHILHENAAADIGKRSADHGG